MLTGGSIAPAFLWWVFLHAEYGTEESTTDALTGLLTYSSPRTESIVAAIVALVACVLATWWWRTRDTMAAATAAAFLVSTVAFSSVNPEAILRVPAPGLCLAVMRRRRTGGGRGHQPTSRPARSGGTAGGGSTPLTRTPSPGRGTPAAAPAPPSARAGARWSTRAFT